MGCCALSTFGLLALHPYFVFQASSLGYRQELPGCVSNLTRQRCRLRFDYFLVSCFLEESIICVLKL